MLGREDRCFLASLHEDLLVFARKLVIKVITESRKEEVEVIIGQRKILECLMEPVCDDDVWNTLHTINSSLLDRKSTRLNSSHVSISYAVFCLKKKINSHIHLT